MKYLIGDEKRKPKYEQKYITDKNCASLTFKTKIGKRSKAKGEIAWEINGVLKRMLQ